MIDAHQHFWRLSRGDYPWPNESVAPIFRDFAPEDLLPLLEAAGVQQTVVVQATDSVAETEYLLEMAGGLDSVAGVVGWVDLSTKDAIVTIERLRANPKLKGLRPMLQNIEETDWINRPEVQPALAHMAEIGLRFDALIQPRHLPCLLLTARQHSGLPIVIDHIAKPAMGGVDPDDAWLEGIAGLATCPNVWCKLSGLITEIGPGWRHDDLVPFARHVLDSFGPERVIWGSDWPVLNLAGDYAGWINAARKLVAHLPAKAQDAIFGGNAERFYGLS
ncbi:amidohydrolase [Paracoccus sp. FO-3]|uniref:amidohydrolase family protein n=1 Tax=Paracoccus sp. FO-3 TaxID=1335059 RepID=UPI00112926A3|nr:amidohydrolase family protein [Paracoccus sp. FO-3]